MLLPEEDKEAFKRWILPKVETISDADVEVLCDYVTELVSAEDDSEAKIRRNCVEALSDVLPGRDTTAFVNEIIAALKSKSYVPHAYNPASVKLEQSTQASQPVPIQSIVGSSTSEYVPYQTKTHNNNPPPNAPTGPAATRGLAAQHRLPDRPTGASPTPYAQQDKGQSSRKRKLKERDTSQPRDGHDAYSHHNAGSDRPAKQPARGGRHGQGGGMLAQNGPSGFTGTSGTPFSLPPFSEIPPFDPTNPMALFAMAAAFGVNIPGMPGLGSQGGHVSNVSCPDYDTKGYCAAGSICPFQHGGAIAVPADGLPQYESRFSSAAEQGSDKRRGGRARASFSNPGPTRDRTNTTLVIEQIPKENFTEEDVRNFFSKFGTIVDVQMQAYKRLAIVKYDTHDAAKEAYNSPKAIFDNRFVKVYWHKSELDLRPQRPDQGDIDMGEMEYEEEEPLDPEEIRKRQADAQKLFEERQRKAEEAAAKAEEIEKKLQETNSQILELRRELAAKSRSGTGDYDLDEDISQDLATLQAEAEDLFAQRDTHAWQSGRGRGASRGGYRGRGGAPFPPRGGYGSSFRGGYRGRGGYGGPRSGVKRLDNRPRRLAVANLEPGSKRDEALRQHLITVPDCSIEPHPHKHDCLIITFQERYQAEMFLDEAHAVPDIGKLDLTWVPNDAFEDMHSTEADGDGYASDDDSARVKDEDIEADHGLGGAEADMDVADDIDQWL